MDPNHYMRVQGDFNMSTFLRDASMWLVISAGGSIVVGVLFLHLFRHYAGVMTRLTIASQARAAATILLCRVRHRRFCHLPSFPHGISAYVPCRHLLYTAAAGMPRLAILTGPVCRCFTTYGTCICQQAPNSEVHASFWLSMFSVKSIMLADATPGRMEDDVCVDSDMNLMQKC